MSKKNIWKLWDWFVYRWMEKTFLFAHFDFDSIYAILNLRMASFFFFRRFFS